MACGLVALVAAAASCSGCSAGAGASASGDVGSSEGDLGERPRSAGIKEGSLDEEGVLLLVNDRAVTADVLTTRAELSAPIANGIVGFRTTADGKPRWFASIDEIDSLPGATVGDLQHLVADARASGYTEAPGFDPPTLARIIVPPGLGRPPTSDDVRVEAGFDGKPTADAVALIRSRLTNTVDPSNERFIAQTIADNHKACTIAIGNYFAQGSPHAFQVTIERGAGAVKFTLLCTVSAVNPTILVAENAAGEKKYLVRPPGGQFAPIAPPKYPVIIRAGLRFPTPAANDPGQGVRVFYPAWSAKVLSAPTAVITEGGQ